MKFSRGYGREEPEINLIPLIDVLLVVIIFLMLTTTYARFANLEINLPSSESAEQNEDKNNIEVDVTADGQITVAGTPLKTPEPRFISEALANAAGGRDDLLIVINADAKAAYQSVVDVMHAAQMSGYPRISFTTQNQPAAP